MIYTVTFNPSLDYIVSVKDFRTGQVNRTQDELIYPGGKGINVSIVLKNLGLESIALGFTAGFTGDHIVQLLQESGIQYDFIQVPRGLSRINVKIRSNLESEINGKGPEIGEQEIQAFYEKLDRLVDQDVLVLAGSIPGSMPSSIYKDIMEYQSSKKVRIVVDATKDLLVNVLQYHPFLIKPNHYELGELFGVTIKEREEVLPYAKKLQEMGAQNVLVSMAGKGAVMLTAQGEFYTTNAPEGKVKNSVGAGDSMVAGFLAGYEETGRYRDAFLMGVCTGSASAFSEELATKEQVQLLLDSLKI